MPTSRHFLSRHFKSRHWLATGAASGANTLLDDSVARWDLNESEGTDRDNAEGTAAYDLIESATTGGVGSSAGKLGNAADLDPANLEQLQMAATQAAFSPASGFTCAGWLKVATFASSDDVIGSYGLNTAAGSWMLQLVAGGDLIVTLSDGSATKSVTWGGTALSTATWYYIDFGYDPSGADEVWVNVDRGTAAVTPTTGFTPQAPQVPVGMSGRGDSTARVADISMDHWGFWDVVKSSADMDANYNSGSALAFSSWQASAGSSVVVPVWAIYAGAAT